MKKKLMMILAVIVMVTMLLPGFLVSAETYYYWNGTGTSGYGNTMKFNMTQGYYAFCVDINTYIHENIKYITKALEDEFDVAKAGRIRAILNYSWDKTSKTEITAIQQALWTVMHGTAFPASFSGVNSTIYGNIKTIYDSLLLLPGIPASDASITNILNLATVGDTTKTLGSSPADYSFDFTATSSTGASITFKVYDGSDALLNASLYSIVDNGGGSFTLTLKNISDPSTFKLEATTLKNKAVDAVVFISGYIHDDEFCEDKSKSQTVVGIKLSETTQTAEFSVGFEDPKETTPEVTTPEETTPEVTTPEETTPEATTSVEATTIVATTTTIALTTETPPLASETTTVQSTTAAQTTTTAQATTINLTTVEIPQTGETSSNNNALVIGLLLLALAGSLTFVVYRSKPVKE